MRLFSVSKNKDLSLKNKKTGLVRKVLVVSGLMMALFMAAPVANNTLIDNVVGVETSYAAELPYSHRWETQSDGNWKYKLDAGGYATTAWVQDEVDHNWYLLGDNGIMRSGIFESYGKYYLLSEVHDGHFGHLVKNGEVYNGITIKADTSADYEGALSQESINALKSLGYQFESVTSVTGTQHVSNGQVTLSSSNNSNTINNTQSQSQSKAEEFAEKGWSLTNEDGVGWQADGTFNWGDGGASKHLTAGGTLSQESVENFLKNR